MKKPSATKQQPKTYLIFSPHPDDVDVACSGTAAVLSAAGNRVVYCIMTNGEKGTHALKQSPAEMIAMREREQQAAAREAGVEEVIFLRQTDGDLEHTKEVRTLVTRVIRQVRPEVVIAQDPGNHRFDSFGLFHRDHRLTAEIVFDAIYPAAGSDAFCTELVDENIFPHQIDEVWFYGSDRPDLYIDITKTIDRKLAALRAHASQFIDIGKAETRFKDRAKIAAKKSGKKSCRFAEPFRRLSF